MSSTSQKSQQQGPLKRRTRIIQLVFVSLAVLATIGLAYWQFSRWNTTSSFQNLGYALQWPAFGAFFIWAYRKYMEYENARFAGDDQAGVKVDPDVMTEIPDDFLPTRGTSGDDAPGATRPVRDDRANNDGLSGGTAGEEQK